MNFKKKINGSWVDTPCYIHNTSTDIIPTLPADIYADGTNATVSLRGNSIQNGTPTPSDPADVNGVGVRTDNLFDKSQAVLGKEIDGLTYKDSTAYFITGFIPVEGGKTYCKSNGESSILLYHNADYEETVIEKLYVPGVRYFTIPSGYNYIVLNALINNIDNVMINAGSTPLPYEPYGYEIPIVLDNTTTPVYLGEVETTRKIKKLVLTGEEDITKVGGNAPFRISTPGLLYPGVNNIVWLCNQYQSVANSASWMQYDYLISWSTGDIESRALRIRDINYNNGTVDDFKSYLRQQYAAGTPVTIWYVLEEPETAIINEPLMKIGDYADTLSNVSIPVTAGGDTLSVSTTVQPSEVTVNYKGWHPAVVHERTNGAWT